MGPSVGGFKLVRTATITSAQGPIGIVQVVRPPWPLIRAAGLDLALAMALWVGLFVGLRRWLQGREKQSCAQVEHRVSQAREESATVLRVLFDHTVIQLNGLT